MTTLFYTKVIVHDFPVALSVRIKDKNMIPPLIKGESRSISEKTTAKHKHSTHSRKSEDRMKDLAIKR